MSRVPKFWTPAEDALLRAHYAQQGPSGMARMLGCETHQARSRAHRLGLRKRARYEFWDAVDSAKLAALWRTASVRYIARVLGRTGSQVRNQAARLGLEPRARAWSTHEERLLMHNYGPRTALQVGMALGRSRDAVRRRVFEIRRRSAGACEAVAQGP